MEPADTRHVTLYIVVVVWSNDKVFTQPHRTSLHRTTNDFHLTLSTTKAVVGDSCELVLSGWRKKLINKYRQVFVCESDHVLLACEGEDSFCSFSKSAQLGGYWWNTRLRSVCSMYKKDTVHLLSLIYFDERNKISKYSFTLYSHTLIQLKMVNIFVYTSSIKKIMCDTRTIEVNFIDYWG